MLHKKFLKLFGIDFHLAMTLILRGWNIIAGGMTIIIISTFLDPLSQGYYYTFLSLLAMQVFCELGLNQIIIQIISHESTNIEIHANGKIAGPPYNQNKLRKIIKTFDNWYAIAAPVFAVVATIVGLSFFSQEDKGLSPAQWMPMWIVSVLATALNLYLSPRLAIQEGFGRVGDVAKLRTTASVFGYLLGWILLVLGGGLWMVTIPPLVNALASIRWISIQPNLKWSDIDHHATFTWYRDVLPLQWRIALSWASGYFIFQLFTPMIFRTQGAVEAGRVGLAITIFGAINTLGMSWISTKIPIFVRMIAIRDHDGLLKTWRLATIRSVSITTTLAIFFVSVIWVARECKIDLSDRVSDTWSLIWMTLTSITNSFIFAAATLMRAHREEPMLICSITGAALSALIITFTSSSTSLMMFLNFGLTFLVGLPWTLSLTKKYLTRRQQATA